jgi:hypothetical protein
VVVGTLALRVEVDGKKGRRGGSSRKNSWHLHSFSTGLSQKSS